MASYYSFILVFLKTGPLKIWVDREAPPYSSVPDGNTSIERSSWQVNSYSKAGNKIKVAIGIHKSILLQSTFH